VYYRLYINYRAAPSKVSFDPEDSSLGRICADSIPPPRTTTSIKKCIVRAENFSELASANLFADISCDTPMAEDHFSILTGQWCPGLTESKPMALVLADTQHVEQPDAYSWMIKAKYSRSWCIFDVQQAFHL